MMMNKILVFVLAVVSFFVIHSVTLLLQYVLGDEDIEDER